MGKADVSEMTATEGQGHTSVVLKVGDKVDNTKNRE